MRAIVPLLLLATALAAGCNTVDQRIREKSAVFLTLPSADQEALRQGHVKVGYTEDMAYIALGKPDEVREQVTDQGNSTLWTYLSYWEEYAGEQHMGYRRQVFLDRKTGRAYVALVPVRASVYRERVQEALRLEFKDGKIIAIEEPKKDAAS
ncbi:hypothetical protein [Nibricoccus sp. IMCC34717]|uniref:hypothetical protein n=1 Tax=Nibricoccus sp. IMCC34717 TaxID=3034021 RepID=UPI00384B2427